MFASFKAKIHSTSITQWAQNCFTFLHRAVILSFEHNFIFYNIGAVNLISVDFSI